jgi:hypothetical protein
MDEETLSAVVTITEADGTHKSRIVHVTKTEAFTLIHSEKSSIVCVYDFKENSDLLALKFKYLTGRLYVAAQLGGLKIRPGVKAYYSFGRFHAYVSKFIGITYTFKFMHGKIQNILGDDQLFNKAVWKSAGPN